MGAGRMGCVRRRFISGPVWVGVGVPGQDDEVVPVERDQPRVAHLPQLLGERCPFDAQVIGQLLAVEGEVELPAVPLEGNGLRDRKSVV